MINIIFSQTQGDSPLTYTNTLQIKTLHSLNCHVISLTPNMKQYHYY